MKKKKSNSFLEFFKGIKPLYYFIAGGVTLLIVLFLIGNQLYVTLNSELSIDLQPVQQSFTVYQNETPAINFSLTVDTPSSCSATCIVTLTDISSGQVLESQTLLAVKEFSKVYDLPISQIAPGQQLFSYRVSCQNQQRALCSSSNETYYKTSLVTVNINQTPAQEHKEGEVRFLLDRLLDDFGIVDTQIQQVIHQATKLDYASSNLLPTTKEETQIGKDLDPIKKSFSDLLLSRSTLLDQWKTQDYNAVDIDLVSTTQEDILQLQNNLQELLASQVQLKESLENTSNTFSLLNQVDIYYIYNFYLATNNADRIEELDLLQSLLTQVNTDALEKNISSIYQLENDVANYYGQLNYIVERQQIREKNVLGALASQFNTTINLTSIDHYCSLIDTSNTSSFDTSYCTVEKVPISFNFSTLAEITFNSESFSPTLSTELPINVPQCCFGGECQACCTDGVCQTTNYPVIFLHGHSFNKANSPEDSLIAFSKFQQRLQKEGFVNGGQLSADSLLYDLPEGEWGKINNPITVRATYYYITFYDVGQYEFVSQKTEKIENYALRLREVIELMKYKTGKDKVVIVAHSMGGLVAREYISLFGETDVDKLIMVGTPNYGVSGNTDKFCSVVGASKECDDMSQDSIFLKRLNAPQNEPKTIPFYTVYGTGCKMDNGEDGDGIVTAQSVILPYATNFEVQGKCTDSLQTDLHSYLMDPDRYPEVYDLVSFILSEN